MRYMVFVIDDGAGLATPDEDAAIDVFNDRLQADGHWVFGVGRAASRSSPTGPSSSPRSISPASG